jgi:hypothetical protein
MGIRIIIRALKSYSDQVREMGKGIYALGFVGGLLDALGGGGWGPIVTTTMVARGNSPRTTIGSVNASEFFVTFAQVITFTIFLAVTDWQVIIGLMLGGVIAAPMAAVIAKKVNPNKLMLAVGILISILSIRTIYLAIF